MDINLLARSNVLERQADLVEGPDTGTIQLQNHIARKDVGALGGAVSFDLIDKDTYVARQIVFAAGDGVELVQLGPEQSLGQPTSVGRRDRLERELGLAFLIVAAI